MTSAIYPSHGNSFYSGASVYTSVFLPVFFRDALFQQGVLEGPCICPQIGRKNMTRKNNLPPARWAHHPARHPDYGRHPRDQ